MEIPSQYNAAEIEPQILKLWEDSGIFKANPNSKKPPFSIIMPPTNANGVLHVGHAVGFTIQDILTRYKRMHGFEVLWLPGADHAGFETQVVYEKYLEKQGTSRFKRLQEVGRQGLYAEMYSFSQKNKELIYSQTKKLGSSCDWSTEMFTLDPRVIKTVHQTFLRLYNDGLVYRAKKPIHWCTKHQTALSDLEISDKSQNDPLYYIKYGPLVAATIRPETIFGDVALAVNPNDARYKDFVGKNLEFESVLGPVMLPVIADNYVDPEFGTGVVKITPTHDPNDFEIGLRHKLESKEVIDQFGRLNELTGKYAGMKIKEARLAVAEALQEKGLIQKIDQSYSHTLKTCYKCDTVIEPRVMNQWFVAVTRDSKTGRNLRDEAVQAVENGDVHFVSKRFKNLFFSWMEIIRDWNISRQIVWGIQIPVWYCETQTCSPIVTDGEAPEICPSCKLSDLTRETDVFDTWFSSGQWPFATLKANGQNYFDKFYPTSVIESGHDIMFKWIAHMMMLGIYVNNQVPFKTVYLHGLVRDKNNLKMSKSKGNVLDPLDVSAKYGTDALRAALIFGSTNVGNDTALSEQKINGQKKFINKIWNSTRFVLMNNEGFDRSTTQADVAQSLTPQDKEVLLELHNLKQSTALAMDELRINDALESLYHFFWHSYCDKTIEDTKERIKRASNLEDVRAAQYVSYTVLLDCLILLHPFMPFVTEQLWQIIFENKSLLAQQKMIV